MSRGFQETSSVYAGSPCSAVRYREPKPPKCHPEREGGGWGGSEGSPHNSWCRSKGRAEILRSLGPTHPSLRSCEEIARRKVGVTLSEKGPNCRGARLCARNSRVRWNPDQGCGRTAVRPYSFSVPASSSATGSRYMSIASRMLASASSRELPSLI